MNYALIEDGIVTNIIWLYPANASDFPNAVPMGDVPVSIGDTYVDGVFYRDGERVLTYSESLAQIIEEQEATIAELDAALLDAAYENIVGGLE